MQWLEPLLGTRAEVHAARGSQVMAEAERAVISEVDRLEQIFSIFVETSDLCALRRTGKTDNVDIGHVMELATAWVTRSRGALNFCMQPLIDLWNVAETSAELPSQADVQQAQAQMRATDAWRYLNLNAIAKGWIADRALARAFDGSGAGSPDKAWLSLGGDLVHRGNEAVVVGIENPQRPYDNVAPMATVVVCNEALATSGGARRWWTINGTRYPKVLDPRTGQPATHSASATVIASDAATADAIATASIVLPVQEAMELAKSSGADVFIVASNGSVHASSERFRPS